MTDISPDSRHPIVVVAGPTAVGKTRLGIELAKRFDGEVINADSRYLYRGMDIGVAKPSLSERDSVPHHLIDVRDPGEEMTLAAFQELAYAAINAVVEGWRIPRVPPDPAFRAELEREIRESGLEVVAARLAAVDPNIAARSGKNARRVIRALEIHHATGLPMSEIEGKGPPPYRALEIGLTMPRAQLHAAIDARVEGQIAAGLVDEVAGLLAAGVAPDAPSMSSIGYRQLAPHLQGTESLSDAVHRIKVDTHRYVRHQETWLRKNPRLIPVSVVEPDWIERSARLVSEFLSDN